jgi:hypothetical protein
VNEGQNDHKHVGETRVDEIRECEGHRRDRYIYFQRINAGRKEQEQNTGMHDKDDNHASRF